MDDLRDRIYEVVSAFKSARAREAAADILEVLSEVASKDKEKGQILFSIRGEERGGFALSPDGASLKRIAPGEKPGKAQVLLDVAVDQERFENALPASRCIQDLAFHSGMRVRGSSPFIVAASAAINRRFFKIAAEGG